MGEGWRDLLAVDWLWALVMLAVGAILLAPDDWSQRRHVELGEIATRNYTAPREVLLADQATTTEKQERARESVLPVYDFDRSSTVVLEGQLARLFSTGRQFLVDLAEALNGVDLPEAELEEALLSSLGAASTVALTPEQAGLFRTKGFSQDLEDRLQTLQRAILSTGVVSNKRQLMEHRLRGVTLRILPTGQESVQLDLYGYRAYPEEVASLAEVEIARWPGLSRAERRLLVGFVVDITAPNVALNLSETNARREAAVAAVEPVYTQIRSGQIIVRKGDTISPAQARAINEIAGDGRGLAMWLPWLGNVLLLALSGIGLWYGLRRTRLAEGSVDARTFGGLVLLLILALVAAKLGLLIADALAESFDNAPFNSVRSYRYGIPYASLALVASLFYGRGAALLLSLCFALPVARLGGGDPMSTVVYVLATSLAAIYALDRLNQRSAIMRAGMVVGLAGMVVSLMLATFDESVVRAPASLGYDLLGALLGGLLVAAASGFVIPLMESLLGETTAIKLLELSDTNLPILRRLAFEAPGSFQHSLMVANLAKSACEAIGDNAVLAYTGGLYHDIGKVIRPAYFVENQYGGENRHDRLAPSMSCLIVVSHVKDGVELARDHRLPQPIIDAIEQHHGTRKLSFFLSRAREQAGDTEVKEHEYRYPGPKPQSKVMGILMFADAVEAASRTLRDPSRVAIRALVDRLLDDCLKDGQLDETDLTLSDLRQVSESFCRVLETIHHKRVDYPGYDFNQRKAGAKGASLRVVKQAK